MHKVFLSLLVGISICLSTNANEIAKYVKSANFGLNSNLSVYVFDKTNDKILYKKNEKKLLNPASTLKPLTFGIAYDILGKNYKFETELYQNNNDIYIKLGADVLLTQKDLNELISNLKNISFENVYIDDTIIDKNEYPSTWLKEDKWPHQRPINPYIIDNNFVQISFVRSSLAKKVDIIQDDEYKFSIINNLQIDEKDKIEITRPYGEKSQIIALNGTISKDQTKTLPVLNPEINFYVKIMKAFKKNELNYSKTIQKAKTPKNATKIASVGHSIEQVSKLILHNSDNFASEIVFKVAAAKANPNNVEDNTQAGIEIFNKKYAKYMQENELIYDASGVSRKNFLSAKTIAMIFSNLIENPDFKKLLLGANQGTMKDRLTFLKDNLKVKTGTMRKLSSLCGTLKTRQGNEVVFATVVQNSKKRNSLLKNFENTIIGIIYKKY